MRAATQHHTQQQGPLPDVVLMAFVEAVLHPIRFDFSEHMNDNDIRLLRIALDTCRREAAITDKALDLFEAERKAAA